LDLSKKILITTVLLVIVVVAGGGVMAWIRTHHSAKSVAASFMSGLAQGDATSTYQQLSVGMRKSYGATQWGAYVRTLGPNGAAPSFVRQTAVIDHFNVYPSNSNPQRFVYILHINHREYQVVAVILKQDGSWKVDDLQGNYK
jgi:hypothetical protein